MKEENTIVLPGTDTRKDLADMQAGRASWNPDTNRYTVNGRTYVVEGNGTVFPTDGPGVVTLSRRQYQVLQKIIDAGGDLAAARETVRRNPHISADDFNSALEVFRHHKSYRGGAG